MSTSQTFNAILRVTPFSQSRTSDNYRAMNDSFQTLQRDYGQFASLGDTLDWLNQQAADKSRQLEQNTGGVVSASS